MAQDEILDLDKLIPEPKKIKLNGKIIDLHPGKLKTLIKLQRSFLAFQNSNGENQEQLLDEVINTLAVLIPAIKDEDMDISLTQLPVLIEVAYKASMPETKATTPITAQKKTTEPSPEP